jgi:predicted DNA-binding transcriptional regulator AlpA
MSTKQQRILRKAQVRDRIPVGKTKFEEDIVPRLTKIQLGPRAVGYLESSVDRLIDELIEESAAATKELDSER